MSGVSPDQEQQIKELAANGNKIAAIAQYREMTGVSLKEAKDAVEAMMDGVPANFSAPIQVQAGELDLFLEDRVKRLLAERKKIEAIKVYREAHRSGLKEAKDAVDVIEAEMRGGGYSNMSSLPAISDDPFAEEAQKNRRRLLIFVVLLLVVVGGLALFSILRSAV